MSDSPSPRNETPKVLAAVVVAAAALTAAYVGTKQTPVKAELQAEAVYDASGPVPAGR